MLHHSKAFGAKPLKSRGSLKSRAGHSAVLVGGNNGNSKKLVVFGGTSKGYFKINKMQEYDFQSKKWKKVETSIDKRWQHVCCVSGNNMFIIGEGRKAWVRDVVAATEKEVDMGALR